MTHDATAVDAAHASELDPSETLAAVNEYEEGLRGFLDDGAMKRLHKPFKLGTSVNDDDVPAIVWGGVRVGSVPTPTPTPVVPADGLWHRRGDTLAVLEELLEAGADANVKDEGGWCLLHWIIGGSDLFTVVSGVALCVTRTSQQMDTWVRYNCFVWLLNTHSLFSSSL